MKAQEKAKIQEVIEALAKKGIQYFEMADKAMNETKNNEAAHYNLGKSSGLCAAKVMLEELLEEIEDQERFVDD